VTVVQFCIATTENYNYLILQYFNIVTFQGSMSNYEVWNKRKSNERGAGS